MDDGLRQLLTLGRGHYEKKQYAQAEKLLSEVVERSQAFADVYNMLGHIYHEQAEYGRAQKAFETALKINPGYTEAALSLAVVYNDLGKYSEARAVYSKALERSQPLPGASTVLDPYVQKKVANLYSDIADVFAAAGLHDRAIAEYQRALELEPSFIDVRIKLADACRDAGRLDEALAQYEEVLRRKPSSIEARNRQGLTLLRAGRKAEAIRLWDEVLAQHPGNRLAELYLRLAKDSGASGRGA